MSSLAVIVIIVISLVLLAIVAAVSRHKKSATAEIQLIGASALVNSVLSPEGTVLIRGELWRARSADASRIPIHTKVRVVEFEGHLLLVERHD